ncbi:hypothetical protein [Ornithinimicrobium panacihumi]|uniref:hypothetical protein n=1 Tax=Ornithinimicrobium panacihumi TaxID=2008449 RepID=UPI003F89945D
MRTSTLWWVAIPLAVLGLVLQGMGEADAATPWEDPLGVVGMLLVIMPLTLALNITLNRRRHQRGETSRDSVEFQAAQQARAGAYTDAVLLGALLFLVLTLTVDPVAALMAMAFLTLAVAAFWIRYRVALKDLRG